MQLFVDMEPMVGTDFGTGPANRKAAAEQAPAITPNEASKP